MPVFMFVVIGSIIILIELGPLMGGLAFLTGCTVMCVVLIPAPAPKWKTTLQAVSFVPLVLAALSTNKIADSINSLLNGKPIPMAEGYVSLLALLFAISFIAMALSLKAARLSEQTKNQ